MVFLPMREFKPFIPDNLPALPSLDKQYPVDIEIGCGVGLHPIIYCQTHQNRQLIAIEHTKAKFEKFKRRADSHNLQNLWPIHANGISFVSKYFDTESVDRFIFLYPNPNPKKAAANKRWHNMPFINYVIKCLKKGGDLVIASNELWYIEEAHKVLTQHLSISSIEAITQDLLERPRSHFERKYMSCGQVCWQIVGHKL